MVFCLKEVDTMHSTSSKDRAAPDQVDGEVTAHHAYNRYGP